MQSYILIFDFTKASTVDKYVQNFFKNKQLSGLIERFKERRVRISENGFLFKKKTKVVASYGPLINVAFTHIIRLNVHLDV